MRPGEYDYSIEGGDALPLVVVLKNGSDEGIPLSGFTSRLEITWDTGSLLLTNTNERLEMGEADSPQTDGEIIGKLYPSETNLLPYGRIAKYEWSVTEVSTGDKTTFLKGYIIRS